jgi:hypothetical protein
VLFNTVEVHLFNTGGNLSLLKMLLDRSVENNSEFYFSPCGGPFGHPKINFANAGLEYTASKMRLKKMIRMA